MSDVDHAEYWQALQDKQNEIERLRAAFDEQNFGRLAVIEECARVAEMWDFQSKDPVTGDSIADAIRALKEKP